MLLYSLPLLLPLVHALHNVTVDNDNSTSIAPIVYTPSSSWNVSANVSEPLNVGGNHRLTQDPNAVANFTFTGIAIYFLSPLWPYNVSTSVALDSGKPIRLDLRDYNRSDVGQGTETVNSAVVWSQSDLTNTQHSLVISVYPGDPYAIVDALIYTVLDSSDTSPTSTLPATASKTSSSSTSIYAPAATTSASVSTSKHILPIALGTVLGICGLALFAFTIWYCMRPPRRPPSEAWTAPGHSYPTLPQMSNNSMNTMGPAPHTTFLAPYPAPYPPQHQLSGASWDSQGFNSMVPMPGAIAAAAATSRPYSHASSTGSSGTSDSSWQGTTAQMAAGFNRAPNRFQPNTTFSSYQPNTLSTITETSSPLGGTASLILSPSSFQTEVAAYSPQTTKQPLPVRDETATGSAHTNPPPYHPYHF